ncbi:unnamed protein product [Caenorhabditis angaria]|uniref:Probable deoxycytidylate deaminase n=1 Tax=Caenorhabditis angaria TaxID=860376 RepID=A0A9P1IKT6_9PELO|nr:unnamed protein product [Caenorhabditis angaria]
MDAKKHQHFMKLALMTAQRSKDPCTQVGCVIVDEEDQIVSTGYNGFPIGVDDDTFRWDKEDPDDCKHLYVVHAEMNAITNKRRDTLHNCTLYVTLFPCNECTKLIIQSRVKRIFYIDDRDSISYEVSRKMLRFVGIPFEKCELPERRFEFDV